MAAPVLSRSASAPLFWTPDGLEVVAHDINAGCRRAVAFDASGLAGLSRRVGACDQRWIGALDEQRGWFRLGDEIMEGPFDSADSIEIGRVSCELLDAAPRRRSWLESCGGQTVGRGESGFVGEGLSRLAPDGEVVTFRPSAFGGVFVRGESAIGFTRPVHGWSPETDGVWVISSGDLYWLDGLGPRAVLAGESLVEIAPNPAFDHRVALIAADGRLLTADFSDVVTSANEAVQQWDERVSWLAAPERKGRLAGGEAQEEVLTWLESQFQNAGLSAARVEFDLRGLVGTSVALTLDGVAVESGFAPLPTVDGHEFTGTAAPFGLGSREGESGSHALIIPLPADWPALRKVRYDLRERPTPLFVQTDLVETFASAPVETMTSADGPPVIAVTAELARRLSEAKKVELRYEATYSRLRSASVVAEVAPSSDEVGTLVITAHWDHIGAGGFASNDSFGVRNFLGANDNGSGVASMLALAERVADEPLPHHRVIFVASGAEEVGFTGMRSWAEAHTAAGRAEPVLAVNFDMMGRLDDARVFVSNDFAPRWLTQLDAASRAVGWPLVEVGPLEDGGYSDHEVVREQWGTPVLMINDQDVSVWHKTEDRPGSLESEAALRATQMVFLFLRSLDGSAGGERDGSDAATEEVGEGVGP